jgi:hypothetical protein
VSWIVKVCKGVMSRRIALELSVGSLEWCTIVSGGRTVAYGRWLDEMH